MKDSICPILWPVPEKSKTEMSDGNEVREYIEKSAITFEENPLNLIISTIVSALFIVCPNLTFQFYGVRIKCSCFILFFTENFLQNTHSRHTQSTKNTSFTVGNDGFMIKLKLLINNILGYSIRN